MDEKLILNKDELSYLKQILERLPITEDGKGARVRIGILLKIEKQLLKREK